MRSAVEYSIEQLVQQEGCNKVGDNTLQIYIIDASMDRKKDIKKDIKRKF